MATTIAANIQQLWEPLDVQKRNSSTGADNSSNINNLFSTSSNICQKSPDNAKENDDKKESSDDEDEIEIGQLNGTLDGDIDFVQDVSGYSNISQIQMEIDKHTRQRRPAFEKEQISFYENQTNRRNVFQAEQETESDVGDSMNKHLDTFAAKFTAIRLSFGGTEKAFQQLSSSLYNLFPEDVKNGTLSTEDIKARKRLIKSEFLREKRVKNQYKVPKSVAIDVKINGEKRNL